LIGFDERGFGLPTLVKVGDCKDAIEEECLLADSNEEDSNCQLESRLAHELALFLGLYDLAPQRPTA
jgi:hypothetical protein